MIAETALRSFVVLLAAGAVARLWHRSPAVRHRVLSLGLATLVLLPATVVYLPVLRLAVLPMIEGSQVTVGEEARPVSRPESAAGSIPGGLTAPRPDPGASPPRRSMAPTAWALGAIVCFIRLAAARLRLNRRAREGSTSPEALVREVEELARRSGLRRRITVLESPGIDVPCTWGHLRPVLGVPRGFSRWEPGRRRRILLHELAHVRRHDALWDLVARVATALFWWNPLAWGAARAAREASEAAADAHVLASSSRPSDYAEDLLAVARRLSRPPWLRGLPGIGRGRLRHRIESVLAERSPAIPTRRVAALNTILTILLLGAAATVLPVHRAAALETASSVPRDRPAPAEAVTMAEPPWPAHQVRYARAGEAGALFLEGDVDLVSLVRDGALPEAEGLLVWFHREAGGAWQRLAVGGVGRSRTRDEAREAAFRRLRRSLLEVAPDWVEHPDTSIGSLAGLPELAGLPRLDFSGSVILGVPGSSRDPGTGVLQAGWYAGGERVGIFARGPLELGAEGRSLEWLSQGGWLAAFGWNSATGRLRLVEAFPGSRGEPRLHYTENGVRRRMDSAARRWLGRVLTDLPGVEPGVHRLSWSG